MKKLTEEDAKELLRRYRMGVCSKEEVEFINRWYQSFDRVQDKNADLEAGDPYELKVEMLANIASRIDSEAHHEIPQLREKTFKNIYLNNINALRRIAAVLVVASGVGLFFFMRDVSFIAEMQGPPRIDNTNAVVEILEATSSTTLYLSDGSVVWLKEASRLEYPKNFRGDMREVTLIGEAFFDVARNKDKPFVIHSANFTTRVLGTSFNIKAYGDQDSQEVVVVTGKVVVSVKEPSNDNVKELVLTPNQKAVYRKGNNSLVGSDVAKTAISGIAHTRKLAFDDVSLEDILKVLSATHGTNVLMENESMSGCIITADLTEESLEASVGILAKAIGATYEWKGNEIILSGKGCGFLK